MAHSVVCRHVLLLPHRCVFNKLNHRKTIDTKLEPRPQRWTAWVGVCTNNCTSPSIWFPLSWCLWLIINFLLFTLAFWGALCFAINIWWDCKTCRVESTRAFWSNLMTFSASTSNLMTMKLKMCFHPGHAYPESRVSRILIMLHDKTKARPSGGTTEIDENAALFVFMILMFKLFQLRTSSRILQCLQQGFRVFVVHKWKHWLSHWNLIKWYAMEAFSSRTFL